MTEWYIVNRCIDDDRIKECVEIFTDDWMLDGVNGCEVGDGSST